MAERLDHTALDRWNVARPWALPLLFFVGNLALKLPGLTGSDIALDEPFSVFYAQQSLPELFELFPRENNPPLHFLVLHAFIAVFGVSAWVVRLPSLLFSCLSAALLFRTGTRHFSAGTGLVTAVLFSLSNFHIYHAHEARAYSLLVLLTILALDRFLRLVDEPDRMVHYAWLALWNVLLIYTHFLGFWVLMAQGAAFFLLPDKRKVWWRLGLAFLASALAYLPYFYVVMARMNNYASVGTWVPQPEWTQLYGNINRFLNGRWVTVIAGTSALIAVLWGGRSRRDPGQMRKWWMLLLVFGLMYGGMYGVSFLTAPMFLDRYLLFVTVPMFLLLAALLVEGPIDPRLKIALAVLVAAAMLIFVQINPPNGRPVAALAERVKAERKLGAPVIICPPYRDKTLLYHLDRAAFRRYREKDRWLNDQAIYPVQAFSELSADILQGPRVVFVDADSRFTHPGNGIEDSLRKYYSQVTTEEFGSAWRVLCFEKKRSQQSQP
ncbi:MAG: glycosyltransferase family 39 protein [Bacteroidota bacterium]